MTRAEQWTIFVCPIHGLTTLDDMDECAWVDDDGSGCGYFPERIDLRCRVKWDWSSAQFEGRGMIFTGSYEKPSHGKSKCAVWLLRVPGQRWHHLACFGTKRHYRRDGSCVHTEEVLANLTEHGKRVTKVLPWGDGEFKPAERKRSPSTESSSTPPPGAKP